MKQVTKKDPSSKGRDRLAVKRLWSYVRPHVGAFIVMFLLVSISTALGIIQPKIIQMAIDGPLVQEDMGAIMRLALIYVFTVFAAFALSYGGVLLTNRTGQSILYALRRDLYDHVIRLPMAYFDTHPIGSLVTRLTNDPENLNELFTSVFTNILRSSFQLLGIMVIMFSMDWRLALFVLALTPFIVVITIFFRKRIRLVYEKERAILSNINAQLSEDISGMRMIQILNREDAIYGEFDETNRDYLTASLEEVKLMAYFRPSVEAVRAIGLALLIYIGGSQYLKGMVTFGVLYAFIDYIQRFFQPLLNLTEVYNIWQSAMTSTNRILRLLDVENTIQSPDNPHRITDFKGRVVFDRVWFAYVDQEWVLKDVSFTIEPGEFVAFVGATGAGKTSIINLLARFYDIQKGSITLDGIDIREYDLTDLRRAIGIVQQDVFLFSDTVHQNLSLGDASITRQDLEEAAEAVNAHGFIQQLPRAYDEAVMERGQSFSAGQRQLLSFARTIVRKPKLLILDEATANIDTETELLIQDALDRASQGRTTIAIAHRISTIANADKIIVLSHGEIKEMGTAEELLLQDGLFRVLYDLQYRIPDLG